MKFLKRLAFFSVLALLCGSRAVADDAPSHPLVLGLATQVDADKKNVEFEEYDRMQPVYKENGIQASLIPWEPFYRIDWPEEKIYQMLKGFDVIHLQTTEEGAPAITPQSLARAKRVSDALARYIREGGGLYIQCLSVRYPNDPDEKYWNAVLQPLGIQIFHEGVFDKTRQLLGPLLPGHPLGTFWFTRNFQAHPILAGVQGLCLPKLGAETMPGVPALQYSTDWHVIVRGEKEAQSYKTGPSNKMSDQTVGTYSSAPPVVAVRTLGLGRIVSYSIHPVFTGLNYLNPFWANVVESAGTQGKPSDSMRMQLNAYKWLAEPDAALPGFGTHQIPPYQEIHYPATVDFDKVKFDPNAGTTGVPGVRGIFGAHTAYSDGTGTVADYVAAAKAAGLSFIVFSDPLEKMTPEKLQKLKADCAAVSNAQFYACPGIEFTDGAGIRWALWGEKIIFPCKSFVDKEHGNKVFTQWNGEEILNRGKYMEMCGEPGCAVVDYPGLLKHGSRPENLWWFFEYAPLVYQNGKLLFDQYQDYLFGLADLRRVGLISFTRIFKPGDVAEAGHEFFTHFPDLKSAKLGLNSRFHINVTGTAWQPYYYVSQGPSIPYWAGINTQMEDDWKLTRGAQRVRLKFIVRADDGIKEVRVHDADKGVIRLFLGHGAKELTREIEMVQDKQHYLTLEVIDENGKRAFSQDQTIFDYKQGLARCGDNMNILGATGMIWFPNWPSMFPANRNFENGWEYSLQGWDTGTPLCPTPQAKLTETIDIKGVGPYPEPDNSPGQLGKLMTVQLGSDNLQIATLRMNNLVQRYDTKERTNPTRASSPLAVGPNEYFERIHTIFSPESRINWFTAWDYRRMYESLKNYRGSFIWHEGEIRFKKDVVLQGAVPIPLVELTCPVDFQKGWGTRLMVTGPDGTTQVTQLQDGQKPKTLNGDIKPGGFIAQLPNVLGLNAVFVPPDSHFTYSAHFPKKISVGLGHDGQQVKAGTMMKYRFAVADFTDAAAEAGQADVEHTDSALNMGGGTSGYPVDMKVGAVKDATFFFTAVAQNQEAQFQLGPQKLIIDLPIRVEGLEDNGCAAVYSTERPWFRYISVVKNIAYFQEPIDAANNMWVGNILVCDNKAVKMTVVIDGQAPGAPPFAEIHNPTDEDISTIVHSPANTPVYGGKSWPVTIPAGTSLRLPL